MSDETIFHFENELEEWETQRLSGPQSAYSESILTKEKSFNGMVKENSQELFDVSLLSFNNKDSHQGFDFSEEDYFNSENNLFPELNEPSYCGFGDLKEESPVLENTRSEDSKPEAQDTFMENLNSIFEEKLKKNPKLSNVESHKAFVNRVRFGKEHDRGKLPLSKAFQYHYFLLKLLIQVKKSQDFFSRRMFLPKIEELLNIFSQNCHF